MTGTTCGDGAVKVRRPGHATERSARYAVMPTVAYKFATEPGYCNRQKQYAYCTGLPGTACCSHDNSGNSFGAATSHAFGRLKPIAVSMRAEALSPAPSRKRCQRLTGGWK